MGKAKTQLPASENLSFEQVWAILQETARRQKESLKWQEEFAKRQEENAKWQKETDQLIKETDQLMKENARQMKDFDKRFGEFSNRFGEVVEHMIAPNLMEKFKELGLKFPQVCSNKYVSDFDNNIFLEIDFMLENGEKAILVEVKTKLTIEYVKEHIKRLEKMREYADLHGDKRSFLGAVAGVVITANVKKYTLAQGFFVIEPAGETFSITPPNGQPKEW